jgi:predicted acetyltransferase
MTGQLIDPSAALHASFLDALGEYHSESYNLHLDARELANPHVFAKFVNGLHAAARPETPRPPGWVPGTTLWYVEAAEYLGTLQIRHSLTPELRRIGGHIGYDVRPSARGRGHATRMLALGLPIAHDLGIDPALVTCDVSNVASRKVIAANGGRLDSEDAEKRRYWIATA